MNIEELIAKKAELDEAIEQLSALGVIQPTTHQHTDHGAWVINENYLIRTVTHILSGRLVAYDNDELVIDNAAWIADTGRYANAVASGSFNEVEPYPSDRRVIVGRGGLIDAVIIDSLPTEKK